MTDNSRLIPRGSAQEYILMQRMGISTVGISTGFDPFETYGDRRKQMEQNLAELGLKPTFEGYQDYIDITEGTTAGSKARESAISAYKETTESRVPKEYDPIDVPGWLSKIAEQGYDPVTKRDLYMQKAIPMSMKVDEQIRGMQEKFSRTGLKSGFQQEAIANVKSERESALSQLQTSIDLGSQAEKEQAIERIKNLERFNTLMDEAYTNAGESNVFNLQLIKDNYRMALSEMNAKRNAAEGSTWGMWGGMGLNLLLALL